MGRSKGPAARRRPVNLAGILTLAEKDQLATLANNIIHKMERQISCQFTLPKNMPSSRGSHSADDTNSEWSHSSTDVGSLDPTSQLMGKEIYNSPPPVQHPCNNTISTKPSHIRALSDNGTLCNGDDSIMTSQLTELKKEVLYLFGKWQSAVLTRVGELEVNAEAGPLVAVPIRGGIGIGGRGRGGADRGGRNARGLAHGQDGGGSHGTRGRFVSNPESTYSAATSGPRSPPTSQIDPAFFPHCGPTATQLWLQSADKRKLMLHMMFLLLLSLEEYHAYSRVFLANFASSLHLPYRAFQEEEVRIARAFHVAIKAMPRAIIEKDPRVATSDIYSGKPDGMGGFPRRRIVSMQPQDAAATTNVLVGSLLSSGIGSLAGSAHVHIGRQTVISLLGPVVESASSIGAFFGVFGSVGPNGPRLVARSMEQFAKDVQDFALLPLGNSGGGRGGASPDTYKDPADVQPQDRRMRIVLGIGGWIDPDDKDMADANNDTHAGPWSCLGHQAEAFAVRWDMLALENLGTALEMATRSKAWEVAKRDVISRSSELASSVSRYASYSAFKLPAGEIYLSVPEVAGIVTMYPNHLSTVAVVVNDDGGNDGGQDHHHHHSQHNHNHNHHDVDYDSDGHAVAQILTTPLQEPEAEAVIDFAAMPPLDMCRYFNQQLYLEHSVAHKPTKALLMYCAVLGTLMEAHWPLSLLKISKIIDNPWHLGMVRAEKTGYTLAEAIIRHVQGNRPVSLVGYSLGARAIYTALMILAERRQLNMVDSVVLIGAPAPSESRVWLTLKSVVAGRLVNVYSETDYLLAFLYRTSNVQFGIAGVQPVHAEGVENHNVGDMSAIGGHLRYRQMIGTVLRDIGWDDLDMKQVERSAESLAVFDRRFETKQAVTVVHAEYAPPVLDPAAATKPAVTTQAPQAPGVKTGQGPVTATKEGVVAGVTDEAYKKRRRRGRRGQGQFQGRGQFQAQGQGQGQTKSIIQH